LPRRRGTPLASSTIPRTIDSYSCAARTTSASDDRALAFRFEVKEVGISKRSGRPIKAPHILWEPDYVDVTATEALQAVNENKAPGARAKTKKFLLNILKNGPVLVTDIEAAAKAAGIAERTLARAKTELPIEADYDGTTRKWSWRLEGRTDR
jgi:putative DNA primase/helicase